MRAGVVAVFLAAAITVAQAADDTSAILDVLVAAYPDHLAGHDGKDVIFKDGTRLPASDGRSGKSFDELLDAPSILDQFAIPYPLGGSTHRPALNEDPGRIRNEAFFRKLYGDCRRGEVTPRLKTVPWLPNRGGKPVMATTVNGVAERLAAVARDLDTLPDTMTKYLVPSSGIYNCRRVGVHRHPLGPGDRADVGARLRGGDRSQRVVRRLLAVVEGQVGRRQVRRDRLEKPFPGRHRRGVRTPRLHLGRQVVSLRHVPFRISAGNHRAGEARVATAPTRFGKI